MNRLLHNMLLLVFAALCSCSHTPKTAQPPAQPSEEKPSTEIPGKLPLAAGFTSTQFVLDLNGDGRDDHVAVILLQGRKIAGQVIIANPWSGKPLTSRDTIGILCRFSNAGTYLLHDENFFSTPLWQAPMNQELIRPIRRPIKKEKRQEDSLFSIATDAQGDMLGIFTEAGIEIGLYFDGASFRLAYPDEEP